MHKHKIHIIELNPLYLSLKELKNNLNFELVNFDFFSKFFNKYNNDHRFFNDSLIISNLSNLSKFSKIKKLNFKEIIYLVSKKNKKKNYNVKNFIEAPISVNYLIEKINIYIIKKKYAEQSKIKLLKYELDINSRKIFNNKDNLKLTEKEIDIIIFLKNSKNPQSIINLQKIVWGYSSILETHTVETHIHRLRKKIKEVFRDEDFILTKENGYFIE